MTYRIRVRDGFAALALARKAAEKAEHVGLLSEIFAFEGFMLAMMGKHDEARARVDSSLELALSKNLRTQAAFAYRVLADILDVKADYSGSCDAQLYAISFCRQQGTVNEEHMCLSCLSYVLFRTGQWRGAIENARKVLEREDAIPAAHASVAIVPAMIGVLRGERRHGNARLAAALIQLRANNLVILEFFALWVRGVMADFEGNHSLAGDDLPSAIALMREAIEGYDRVGTMLEMAFLRRRVARMLASSGQPREACEKRREAEVLGRRLGLRPFLDRLEKDTIGTASSLSASANDLGAAIGLTPR
ncbi:MAG: hypothetical protein JO170_22435, partial [Verrucomicrobia bacterium]|nr:hypothetical protein [Verrucomicrobiota bacterium]